MMSELVLLSSLSYSNENIAEVAEHLAEEKYGPTPVITHHFWQEQAVETFQTMIENKDEAIKVIVDVHP